MENPGVGLRGVVYTALIDSKRSSGFKDIQIDEMFLHPHTATVHNNLSQSNTQNVTKIMSYMVKQHQKEIKEMNGAFSTSFHSSINRIINTLEHSQPQRIIMIMQMKEMTNEDLKTFHAVSRQIEIALPITDN